MVVRQVPPPDGSDAIEMKIRAYAAPTGIPWWFCTNCLLMSNAEFHACPQAPYYCIDMSGLRFLP